MNTPKINGGDILSLITGYVFTPPVLLATAQIDTREQILNELLKGLAALLLSVLSRWIYSKLAKKNIPVPAQSIPLEEPQPIFLNEQKNNSYEEENEKKSCAQTCKGRQKADCKKKSS